ncbi:MAG TPA: ATP-binding protein, partial [Anaerolineales bacterium]|nr:ATP-binding protein [Anaerolineales bacterium]
AYVIFQRKLLKVDFLINRLVVWFTLILLILIASILAFGVLVIAFDLPAQLPIYGGVVAALIALPFSTLSKTVQDSVDRILYGSHYDYWTVTSSMSRQLAQTLDRNQLISLLTEQLPQQMGIRQTELLLVDGGSLMSEQTTAKLPALSLDNNFCRELRRSHVPMRASQAWNLISPDENKDWSHCAWAQIFAPLVFKDELQGILILGQRVTGDVYSDQDLSIIATVAEQGALALVNVILFEKQRRLARQLVRSAEEERKRLASDLHDTVLQELFFIKQGLHQNPGNPALVDYLDESIQNLRQSIKTHRPPLLDKGLTLALQGLIEDVRKISGSKTAIIWSTNIEGSPGLNDEQATVIFRIAQEALNNAVKHAKASLVEVSLEQCPEQITHLKVSDNGSGLPWLQPDGNLDHAHFGLVLMQERAAMIDARLHINTLPGEGTTIELEVTA